MDEREFIIAGETIKLRGQIFINNKIILDMDCQENKSRLNFKHVLEVRSK